MSWHGRGWILLCVFTIASTFINEGPYDASDLRSDVFFASDLDQMNSSVFVRRARIRHRLRDLLRNHSWIGKSNKFLVRGPPRGLVDPVMPTAPLSSQLTVIAFHVGHDAGVALSINGRVQCVLELERLTQQRYFHSTTESFSNDWMQSLPVFRDQCECEAHEQNGKLHPGGVGSCPRELDYGVIVGAGFDHPSDFSDLPFIVEQFFRVSNWQSVDHSEAHALGGFFDSPFRSALITVQGAAHDGNYNAYIGVGLKLYPLGQFRYNFGPAYEFFGELLPEVLGCPLHCKDGIKGESLNGARCPKDVIYQRSVREILSLPGKLMGYAGTGELIPSIHALVRDCFAASLTGRKGGDPSCLALHDVACNSSFEQRAIAASAQAEYDKWALEVLTSLLERSGAARNVEGIVLTGGPALNVLANQLICEKVTVACDALPSPEKAGNRLQGIHVPAAPSDCGLVVGALWKVKPPMGHQPLQYVGFRLFDIETLDEQAYKRNARRLSALGGVEYLAELLAGGAVWKAETYNATNASKKPIIAIVRGRQEFGPRALGHRSLVAVPDSDDIRDRMNKLKFRQWYRPVAPMIADEALEKVFGANIKSPYMTMAPQVARHVRDSFPALAHVDGTARHQSVGKLDEPWLHSLLLAVGKLTGLASLINTSFNSKGKPITNTVHESLKLLDTSPDLDYVLIEDWLFHSKHKLGCRGDA